MFGVIGFLIVLVKATTNAEEDLYYHNGWRPLTSEEVLGNNQRKFITPPVTAHSTDSWNSFSLSPETIGYFHQNGELKPYDINKELMSRNFNGNVQIDLKQDRVSVTDAKQNYNGEYLTENEVNIIHNPAQHQRKAKNIIKKENFDTNVLHSYELENDITVSNVQEKVKIKESDISNSKSNNYEVTEATEAFEMKDLLNINKPTLDEKKSYFQRSLESTTESNLSNVLFKILGNYNIKINDNLSNYALSRNHNSNSNKQGYVHSGPMGPPIRNSQNYFPIDPVFAVFLSNYGYYLPGFYGFPANYNNIYGYLASNNIHNNKPFGAYKIYSDTDSSH